MNKEQILKIALEQETIDNILVGDIWVDLDIKTEEYPNGVFTQFEKKELDNGEYSDDIYCVYGYKNIIKDGEKVSNYDTTVFKFEFDKSELIALNNQTLILNQDKSKNDNSALEQIRNEMTAPKETTIQSNARRNK